MAKISAKATIRKRSKRIQKKIDKRDGYLRHEGFRSQVYIFKLSSCIGSMADTLHSILKEHRGMGSEMIDIVKDATKRAQGG